MGQQQKERKLQEILSNYKIPKQPRPRKMTKISMIETKGEGLKKFREKIGEQRGKERNETILAGGGKLYEERKRDKREREEWNEDEETAQDNNKSTEKTNQHEAAMQKGRDKKGDKPAEVSIATRIKEREAECCRREAKNAVCRHAPKKLKSKPKKTTKRSASCCFLWERCKHTVTPNIFRSKVSLTKRVVRRVKEREAYAKNTYKNKNKNEHEPPSDEADTQFIININNNINGVSEAEENLQRYVRKGGELNEAIIILFRFELKGERVRRGKMTEVEEKRIDRMTRRGETNNKNKNKTGESENRESTETTNNTSTTFRDEVEGGERRRKKTGEEVKTADIKCDICEKCYNVFYIQEDEVRSQFCPICKSEGRGSDNNIQLNDEREPSPLIRNRNNQRDLNMNMNTNNCEYSNNNKEYNNKGGFSHRHFLQSAKDPDNTKQGKTQNISSQWSATSSSSDTFSGDGKECRGEGKGEKGEKEKREIEWMRERRRRKRRKDRSGVLEREGKQKRMGRKIIVDRARKTGMLISKDDEKEGTFSHGKINKINLSYLVCNIRGYSSKKASFRDILNSSEFDVVMVSETHLYNGKKPTHPGYNFIGRSREKMNSKGGVAIGYKKELAHQMVKVAEGSGNNEFILVRCSAVTPNIIFGVVYGAQEGTTPDNVITENLTELFTQINKFKEEGLKVVIGGDTNLHIGEEIEGNDPKVSKGGKKLLELCDDFGLDFANKLGEGNKHTHFDVTSKTSRVLDLVITDMMEEHVEFQVDHGLKVTPFVPRFKQGKWIKNFTDHRSLVGEIQVEREKQKKIKIKMWKMNRPGGKNKYYELTDMKAEDAMKIIRESKSTEEMYQAIQKLIEAIKDEAYGRRTVTMKRMEREKNEALLTKRKEEIKQAIQRMDEDGKRLNEKIFLTRNQLDKNDDDEIMEAIDHYKTGERLEDPDKIIESILDYNEEVLKKKENVSEETEKKRNDKKEAVEFFKTIEDGQTEEPISWDEYLRVVKRVMAVNKGCYKDFNLAGPRWKTVMFSMFQRIYLSEQIPDDFKKTTLKKLYKRKGDKTKLTSYRFIHLKQWAGKMMEKLVLEKCETMIEKPVPEMQIGGQKKSSTIEHIMTVLTRAKISEKEKKCLIVQLLDIVKCFDKVLLSDTLYDISEAGVFGKRLRMIQLLHENTRISLSNDPKKRERIIKNSTGQGTNWAPSGCARSIAEATERATKKVNNEIKIKGKDRGTVVFVDDTLRMATDTKMARDGGKVFTEALDELSLEAHPDKSKIVVMGPKKAREEVKAELQKDPVIVQGWEMKTSKAETYLGYQIDEGGVRECKTKSIEGRVRIARTKSIQLLKVLEDEQIGSIGWLESAKLLFTSIIIPTLTYGSQTYVRMTKKQSETLEMAMRENLYRMLGLSRTAHYASVLMEMNLIPINAIIEQLKIGWLNSLIHEKGFGTCLDTIMEEEEKYPGTGIVGEVKELCKKYGLPDITIHRVTKRRIKEMVWDKARMKLCREANHNRRVPYNGAFKKEKKEYWGFNRIEAKLMLGYKTGELNFKEFKRWEMKKKFGNTDCFVIGCKNKDTLTHVMQCEGYETKPEKFALNGRDRPMANYLKELDQERWKKYKISMIYRRDRVTRINPNKRIGGEGVSRTVQI